MKPTLLHITSESDKTGRDHSNGSNSTPEPIAIVGMAMRLPGGVHSLTEFREMLINKRESRCEIPAPDKAASNQVGYGYFLRGDPALFDARFFGISMLEAERMDPQQRLLLEIAWECLESAGETDWWGKDIGCYVGILESIEPNMTTTMTDNGMLSPEGICQTFNKKADGFGRAEAINAGYIKPLCVAIRDRKPIRALIRATYMNFDGRTPNMTSPCPESQEALIRSAYARAGIIDIEHTAVFECHRTATIAGDKVEASVVAKLATGYEAFIGATVIVSGLYLLRLLSHSAPRCK
ncbi:thiolase-like protein [Aspergillus spectabilis]